ncbi:efflux RND transporter periplasmic adaptor subunit [bacterium]|nr:efflux RND transporter periplasmic adaptor subunit [bacterium]
MQFDGFFKQSMKWISTAAVLLSLLAWAGCKKTQSGPAHLPEVSFITVGTEPVTLTTELPGRTTPFRIAEIRPQVSGLIQKRLFTEGADVKAGEVLYQIDPAPFQAALNNAKAALGRSEANLSATRARAERYKELLADRAVSQQDVDDAAAALTQNEADIQYWKAMLQTASINLAYTRVTAPISGRIGKSSVTEGAIVTAYQPLALTTIQQLDPIYVDVQQSTAELARLRSRLAAGRLNQNGDGQQNVKLFLSDDGQYPLDGTLQFRDISVEPSTGSVTLRAVFSNPDGILLPGMFVRALIKEGDNPAAVLAPQPAVMRDAKGNPFAYVLDEQDQIQIHPLTLDRAIGDKWLLIDGLAPGERLVVDGLQRVRPGMKVTATPYAANNETGAQSAPQAH